MRKLLLMIALVLPGFSYSQQTSLSLCLHDSSMFTAVLNGNIYNDPSNVMNFSDLPPGNQQLKVIKLLKTGNSIVEQPVFEGVINLKQGSDTKAYIDRYNQFRVSVTKNNDQEVQRNNRNTQPYFVPDPSNINRNAQPVTTAGGMNNEQFAGQLETLKSINVEQERYRSATGLIALSTYSSNQLAEMMLLFNEEGNRVNLAAEGYDRVSDKNNFGVVYNSLRYPSSIKRLARKIN
jgi:hypothetical protein